MVRGHCVDLGFMMGSRQISGNFLGASCPFHQRVPDFKPHRCEFVVQLVIPETQHFDALFRKKLVSLFIPRPLVGKTMSAAVEFHGQFRHRAIEIEKVDTARVLTAEFEFIETAVTEQTPQAFLGICGFLAEFAGEAAGGGGAGTVFAGLRRFPPLPPRPDPLPRWRRGNFVRAIVSHRVRRLYRFMVLLQIMR